MCRERGIDVYEVLGEILRFTTPNNPYELASLNTDNIIRALRREHNILVSYKRPRHRGGRPSQIPYYLDVASRWGKEAALHRARRELKKRTYFRFKKLLLG